MHRIFRINLDNPADRNAWYLVLEIGWASILGSAASFNAAFALRLGATNAQVALMTSIPALLAVLVSLPSGVFLRRKQNTKPWLLWSLIIYRFSFLIIAALPLFSFSTQLLGPLVISVIIGFTSLAHFWNIGFIPWLTEIVPERNRASVFAARNIVYNGTLSIFGFLFGLWLERTAFPGNYQAMYAFGFACSLLSMLYLMKLQAPATEATQTSASSSTWSLMNRWKALRQAMQDHRGFVRFTLNTVMHGIGVWAVTPLYILYFVRTLEAKETWLGLNGTVSTLFTLIGFALWRWVIRRWGEPITLKRTIILIGLYPVVVGLIHSLPAILIITAANGLLVPGVSLSHFTTLLKVTPERNRPGYTAAYVFIANIGIFIFPLVGVALADLFGLVPVMIAGGILSIVGSSSFIFWPVQPPEVK
jgi:MFS family permease